MKTPPPPQVDCPGRKRYLWALLIMLAGPILWFLIVACSTCIVKPLSKQPVNEENWYAATFWLSLTVGFLATPIGLIVGCAMAASTLRRRKLAKEQLEFHAAAVARDLKSEQ